MRLGAAILAAGSSSRLGKAKQLVVFNDKFLLQHMIDAVESIECAERMVILGAGEKEIINKMDLHSLRTISNPNWEEGIASSLRLAIEQAEKKNLDALLVLLSDQPFVNALLLNQLIEQYVPNEEMIIASSYKEIFGVPALFDQHYFKELLALKGDTGARKLINTYRNKVKGVKFEKGVIDIDTPEDLQQLK